VRPTLADVVRLNLNSRPHPPTLPAGAAFLAASHALHIANTPAPLQKIARKKWKTCAGNYYRNAPWFRKIAPRLCLGFTVRV